MGLHLIGLELSLVGQVRVPSPGMPAVAGLHALYDYTAQIRSLQSNAVNAPVTAPKALHPPFGGEPLGPGQIPDKPLYFFLFHRRKT